MSSSAVASGSNSVNQSSTPSSTSTSSISVPQTAAAGGVTVLQPPTTGSASYYKIAKDEFITFRWNLTSLYVRPTSLTIIASCSANGNTYPVGPTASPQNVLPGNATAVIWNPWQWEQIPGQTPFAAASYVLKIWDERGQNAAIKGGYLSPYSGTQFGMYRPQTYTPLSNWTCTTCSAAMLSVTEPTHIAIFTSILISIISFWGILRRCIE